MSADPTVDIALSMCFRDSGPRVRRGTADVGEETGWRLGAAASLIRRSMGEDKGGRGSTCRTHPRLPLYSQELDPATLFLHGNAVIRGL